MLVYKQLTILKSRFSETRLQRPVNIFAGVGGQLFFLFIYLSIFFIFLRFHFPDLTFLKLFLLSFCLVLKTLSLQLSFSSLSYFVSKGRDAGNFNKFRTS